MTTPRQFQRLDHRMAGKGIDDSLFDGVPPWLDESLRSWLAGLLSVRSSSGARLAQRVALRLRLEPYTTAQGTMSNTDRIVDFMSGDDRLLAVDAALQLHPAWDTTSRSMKESFAGQFVRLNEILEDASSAYVADADQRCLLRRVDPTVELAARSTVATAPTAAADHLRQAWLATYGLAPDPDKAFQESVRAVEELACPLVENRRAEKDLATLGTVLGELGKNSGHKWELVLPGVDGKPRDVGHLVGMMETLWQAQVSRHGGGTKSRRQLQAEAEATVHLAVLLVQWLGAGVLRRKQ